MLEKLLSQKLLSLLGLASIVALVAALGLTTYLTGRETKVPTEAAQTWTAFPTVPTGFTEITLPGFISGKIWQNPNRQKEYNFSADICRWPDDPNPIYQIKYWRMYFERQSVIAGRYPNDFDNNFVTSATVRPTVLDFEQDFGGEDCLDNKLLPSVTMHDAWLTANKAAILVLQACYTNTVTSGCFDQLIVLGELPSKITPTPTLTLTPTPTATPILTPTPTPPTVCGPGNCNGCCDPNNTCQPGDTNTACGKNGAQCVNCVQANNVCESTTRTCVAPTVPPTTCNSTNCAGCCLNNVCYQGTSDTQCGMGGNLCTTCPSGYKCTSGSCAPVSTVTPISTITPTPGDSCKQYGDSWECWTTASIPCPGEVRTPPDGTCRVGTSSSNACCNTTCPTIAAPRNVNIQTVRPMAANAFLAFANEADINGDGKIDGADASALVSSWGKSKGETGYNSDADLNNDGKVNAVDASILVSNWTK